MPLSLVDGKLFSYFRTKANLFNNIFALMYTPIENPSALSSSYKTTSRIKSFHITKNDILQIITSSDSNKVHVLDNTVLKMIQICNESITVTLKIISE